MNAIPSSHSGRSAAILPLPNRRSAATTPASSAGRADASPARVLSPSSGWYSAWGKRAADLLLASLGLVLLSLPLLICALLVRLSSPGGALYGQTRLGRKGRTFRIWKLRTMRADAESDGCARFAVPGDGRVTPIGRFLRATRLDEVPQLWNVLRGDMSLVGPRPERPVFAFLFQREIDGYNLRHRLRPGVTGWAQIHLGYCSTLEETRAKTELDLAYLAGLSPGLDLVILLRTPGALIRFLRGNRRDATLGAISRASISRQKESQS